MQRSSIPARTGLAVVLSLLSTTTLAASPPCALNPLWRFDDLAYTSYDAGSASDSDGNVYLIRYQYLQVAHELISLDQNGRLRFRTPFVSSINETASNIEVIGGNVVVASAGWYDSTGTTTHGTLRAFRTEDGALSWSRDLVADLRTVARGTIQNFACGTPAVVGGKIATPVTYIELLADGQTDRRDGVAEYDPGTGSLVRIIQSGPVAVGISPSGHNTASLVVDEQENLFLEVRSWNDGSMLHSWNSAGGLRFSESGVSAVVGTASGFVVAGPSASSVNEWPFQVLRSNGVLVASTPHPFLSPLISGSRLSYVECTGAPYACETASLAAVDLGTNRLLWRTSLGARAGAPAQILDPILTTARSVVLLQQPAQLPRSPAALREFDSAGNEYVTCTLPPLASAYEGYTIAGRRFVAFGFGTVLGFDSYGHAPAAKGWVMRGGGPQGQMRPRTP